VVFDLSGDQRTIAVCFVSFIAFPLANNWKNHFLDTHSANKNKEIKVVYTQMIPVDIL